eukprot:986994_1
MYALRIARHLYKRATKPSLKCKLITTTKAKLSIKACILNNGTIYGSISIMKTKHTTTTYNNKHSFHGSISPRWATPDQLSTSELRRECDRRQLSTKGSRTALIERLREQLELQGGYDNGLTLDDNLANEKRQIESQLNKIPDKHFSNIYLYVEERFQKKVAANFDDSRIRFHTDAPSHIKLEGKYAEIVSLRNQITECVSDRASKETIYSLPHHIVLRLKRSILADIRRTHDVNFTIMRHKHNGEDMMLVAVEGEPENRLAACDILEDVITKIKSHSVDVPGLESYASGNNNDMISHPSIADAISQVSTGLGLKESASDCFNVFNGIILYLDPRMREMMSDYQSRLDQIGVETECNIYLGNRDLFWLNDFQLAIEGNTKQNIMNARQQIDTLINHLKSLTMSLVLPP